MSMLADHLRRGRYENNNILVIIKVTYWVSIPDIHKVSYMTHTRSICHHPYMSLALHSCGLMCCFIRMTLCRFITEMGYAPFYLFLFSPIYQLLSLCIYGVHNGLQHQTWQNIDNWMSGETLNNVGAIPLHAKNKNI